MNVAHALEEIRPHALALADLGRGEGQALLDVADQVVLHDRLPLRELVVVTGGHRGAAAGAHDLADLG